MMIFNLSLHRTGTQSFNLLMSSQLKSLHFVRPGFVRNFNNEDDLWQDYKQTYIDSLDYTCFSDFPVPIFLEKLFDYYPSSKFIFFSRNKEKWVNSVEQHIALEKIKQHNLSIDEIFYKKYSSNTNIDQLTRADISQAYDNYHRKILDYKNRILFCNLDESNQLNTQRISRYLGIKFDRELSNVDYVKDTNA